jgi:hypothetical protein
LARTDERRFPGGGAAGEPTTAGDMCHSACLPQSGRGFSHQHRSYLPKCALGASAADPGLRRLIPKLDSAEDLTASDRSDLQHYFDLGVFIVINPAEGGVPVNDG